MIEEPRGRGAVLGNVIVKGSLGCNDHEIVEFKIPVVMKKAHSEITTLVFRRLDFGLFRNMFHGVPWYKALEGREAQET